MEGGTQSHTVRDSVEGVCAGTISRCSTMTDSENIEAAAALDMLTTSPPNVTYF